MTQSGLSPFTNQWYRVHNFTPDSAQFTVSEKTKPIGQTYGPVHNWLPDLKQERISIDATDSFFLYTPINRNIETTEVSFLSLLLLLSKVPGTRSSPLQSTRNQESRSVSRKLLFNDNIRSPEIMCRSTFGSINSSAWFGCSAWWIGKCAWAEDFNKR
jgi:hypothetical protein